MITKTIVSPTCNSFGFIIPTGARVKTSTVEGSDLVKCYSSDYGVFYTSRKNVR